VPVNTPTAAALQQYLNDVFGKQVNVFFTVTRTDHVLNFDLNRNGTLNMSGHDALSEEEMVLDSQARNPAATFNIYYVKSYSYLGSIGKAVSKIAIAYIRDYELTSNGGVMHTIVHEQAIALGWGIQTRPNSELE
jgi:hypothetical protein